MNFTQQEKDILHIVQTDLPDSLTPYADIAALVGCTEDKVLNLLQSLKDDGVIRRFGASIKHQRTGWAYNAMVAWQASLEQADRLGPLAAQHKQVSHCYFRPSDACDWPYTLYTMVHGRNSEECQQVIADLRSFGLPDNYLALDSLAELKKISMTYF